MTHDEAIEQYIEQHIGLEDPYLYRLYRSTHLHLTRPRMASGHLQGKLLRMLTQMINPKLVFEIGTFSGYSALALASGLSLGAQLHTFEIDDEQAYFTLPLLQNSPWGKYITLHVGDACKLLPIVAEACNRPIDLVFMDADKRQYLAYYEMLLPFIAPGGYILADNTLWDGHVTDPHYARDAQTQGICQFNDFIAQDCRVDKVILPLRDGLTLIRKVDTSNSE